MGSGLHERLEDGLEFVPGNAHPRILHFDQQRDTAASLFLPLHTNIDAAPVGKLDGIADEIDQHLAQADAVHQQGVRQILGHAAFQLHALLGRRFGKDSVKKIT